jgi:hypothetical protein
MGVTTYICGNPFSAQKLSEREFGRLVEVWKHQWDDIGTVPPRAVTDWTIDAAREGDADRIIAHYLQPHCPFLGHPELMDSKDVDRWGDQNARDVWQKLRDGDLTRDRVWEGYRSNLDRVLGEVELLLENVDASRVVITSDHGNSLGELFVYGHPPKMPLRGLREVPWIETSATDSGTHKPSIDREEEGVSSNTEEKLRALGYAE